MAAARLGAEGHDAREHSVKDRILHQPLQAPYDRPYRRLATMLRLQTMDILLVLTHCAFTVCPMTANSGRLFYAYSGFPFWPTAMSHSTPPEGQQPLLPADPEPTFGEAGASSQFHPPAALLAILLVQRVSQHPHATGGNDRLIGRM